MFKMYSKGDLFCEFAFQKFLADFLIGISSLKSVSPDLNTYRTDKITLMDWKLVSEEDFEGFFP